MSKSFKDFEYRTSPADDLLAKKKKSRIYGILMIFIYLSILLSKIY